MSPEPLFHILLCSCLLVFQLLLQFVDPEMTTHYTVMFKLHRYVIKLFDWQPGNAGVLIENDNVFQEFILLHIPVHQLSVLLLQLGFDIAIQQNFTLQLCYFLLEKSHLIKTETVQQNLKSLYYCVGTQSRENPIILNDTICKC